MNRTTTFLASLALAALPAAILALYADVEEARSEAQVAYDLNPYGFPMHMATSDEDAGLLELHDRRRHGRHARE